MEFVRVDPPGCDLAVVRRAPSSSPPKGAALFLHGLGDASSAFAQALEAEALAPFEIVLVDLLGHGSSDKPANFDYRPASHAAVLFLALRALALRGPLHLVGYSLGGAVALELSRFPLPALSSLVLVEPALDASRMAFAARVAAVTEGEFRARYAQFLEPYAAQDASDCDRLWAETAAFASSVAFYRSAKGALEAARRGELLAHLAEARVAKSLIVSRRTRDDWPLVEKWQARGERVFVLDAPGRAPHYECPQEFYEAVRAAFEPDATARP